MRLLFISTFIFYNLIHVNSLYTQIPIPQNNRRIVPSENNNGLFPKIQIVEKEEWIDELEEVLFWNYPAETPGEVGQYEKLEISVSFDSLIEAQILNHTYKRKGMRINPFNPEELDVYAEFWLLENGKWLGPIRINGFYFQDYERLEDSWQIKENNEPFRIRFAPEYTGIWRCRVTAIHPDKSKHNYDEFTFKCVNSTNQGFVQVGENKRYFTVGNDPFFPIGQNLTGPNNPSHVLEWGNKTAGTQDYIDFQNSMTTLSLAGGNYFRYIVSPWQTEIEFEELGNYSNRMSNAWEFDQILDHAKLLDLKLHMNFAMHYSFEAPNSYAMTDWDWSARGDSLNPTNVACFKATDMGYCYRNELNLENPLDFLTDSNAINYYKKRLRYMVARWGYSTNIAVIELLSEANNFGNEAIIELGTVDGAYGCRGVADPEDIADRPYEDYPEKIIPSLMNWQIEMCRYMKEDLGLTQHPIAVNYTGEPDFFHGDSTYYSKYVDIASFNNYSVSIDKFVKNYVIVSKKYHNEKSNYYLDKPMMHSEYGPGGSITSCDQAVRYIKTVNLTPFSGLAGSGMSWHYHWNEDSAWNYLKPIAELMKDVPLDKENWQPRSPIILSDNSIEILYLARPKYNGASGAVGAISNRTFNFYTQGLDLKGADCRDDSVRTDIANTPIYVQAQSFSYDSLSQKIKINNMGSSTNYRIEWVNALTGEYLEGSVLKSNIWGKLELPFPGVLSGGFESPIIFFKVKEIGSNIDEETGTRYASGLKIDSNLKGIIFTVWN